MLNSTKISIFNKLIRYISFYYANTKNIISFSFIENGIEKKIKALEGETLLDVCRKNNINLEGACEGNCACSTCHLILEESLYKNIPPPKEEEEDMLELAFGLTQYSRLGCQVKVDKMFEGKKISIPERQRNVSIEAIKNSENKYKI